MKRVVIIGGGYAGVTLAKALDATLDVVLIERKDRFYHNVGAMRAYADPSLFRRLLIPYDRLLVRGSVVAEEVISVSPGFVQSASGSTWEAAAIVVATGSRYALPFKSGFREGASFLAEAETLSARLAEARRVTILGDGPVAVELAGEISFRYPAKQIQLIGASSRLIPTAANPGLGARLQRILSARGVEIILGRRVSGDAIDADMIVRACGSETVIPGAGYVAVAPRDSAGRLLVDGHFALPGAPGLYAIGDAAAAGEPPLTFLARRQARFLARHLKASLADGKDPGGLPIYAPVRRTALAVPLGPREGAVQLPFPGHPVFGDWLTSRLKGRDLFIKKNWGIFNRPVPGE